MSDLPPNGSVVKLTQAAGMREHKKKIAEALASPAITDSDPDAWQVPDPDREVQMTLTLDQFRPYEHNPREADNPEYAEIKESIRLNGLQTVFTVTRRPGDTHFIIEAGGGTRYRALTELWQETGDRRFYEHIVIFKPWKSEAEVKAKHLAENNLRGAMTFWDSARGTMALAEEIEREEGAPVSLRDLEPRMAELGFVVKKSHLSRYRWAVETLPPLGEEALQRLSATAVIKLQPRLNLYTKLAGRMGLDEAEVKSAVIGPALEKYGRQITDKAEFRPERVFALCEENLAARLKIPGVELGRMLEGLEHAPKLEARELRMLAKAGEMPAGNSGVSPVEVEGAAAAPEETRTVSEIRASVYRLARDFAAMPGFPRYPKAIRIENYVREYDGVFGFYMDPAELSPVSGTLEYWVWWMLSALCLQWEKPVIDQFPPPCAMAHGRER